MKKLAVILLLCALAPMAAAQSPAYTGYPYASLNAANSAGPGTIYSVQPMMYSYTWTVAASGTISAATINFEGSLDGATWYMLDQAANTDANWSAGEMRHVVNKPINFLRLNLVSIVGGGTVTGKISLFR
jgi:hypothetical protein